MPLSALTGTEGTHLDVLNKINSNLTYLDGKSSGGGTYNLSGNANYIPYFDAIADADIDSALNLIVVGGRATEGDCGEFRMYPGGAGVADAWYGVWSTTDANGRHWTYQVDNDEIWFEQSGAPHDIYTDHYTTVPSANPWFTKTCLFLSTMRVFAGTGQASAPTIWMTHHPSKLSWFFDDSLVLQDFHFNLLGHCSGKSGGRSTNLRFPNGFDKPYLIIDHNSTNAGVSRYPGPNGYAAEGSIIKGLNFFRANPEDFTSNAPGIFARSRFLFMNNHVSGCDGNGITCYADEGTGTLGNVDCFLIASSEFSNLHGWGIALFGSITNAGMLYDNTCYYCWQGGVLDTSLLGNNNYSQHIEACPPNPWLFNISAKPTFCVAHAGAVWLLLGLADLNAQAALGSTTEPGTNSDVWEKWFDAATPTDFATAWTSGIVVRPGAPLMIANFASSVVIDGAYVEEGHAPSQFVGKSWVRFAHGGQVTRSTRRSLVSVDIDNVRLAGGFRSQAHDDDADPDTAVELQISSGRSPRFWELKRGITGGSTSSYLALGSYQNGSYYFTTDSNTTRDDFHSAFVLSSDDAIDAGHHSTVGNFGGSIHARYFRVGEKGQSRAFGATYTDPTGLPAGRGDTHLNNAAVPGGNAFYHFYQGDAESGGSKAAKVGYIPWKLVFNYDPPSLAHGASSPAQVVSFPGAHINQNHVYNVFLYPEGQGVMAHAEVTGTGGNVTFWLHNISGVTKDLGSMQVHIELQNF